ncbi:MAG: 3-keto-5-aminohexanoate cleavage protein [Peptococcaceae bacterium]|jgi:3-keto-5-aminohexanoate cleavage enzyme|nr:3-keto-5-aminohexanoate cleavage protein [Peptococcaceae bacterium]MDH7525977.1 3-keto-5-aminohexanoate cleavage protein [Peptococcaceae bacterium]
MSNKINWAHVEKMIEQYGREVYFRFYGLPEICDPTNTAFAIGVDVQPPWKIPPKIAVSTAITGALYSKRNNPNQPVTPEEIYNSAREACLAGAQIVHIHVRDENGYSVLEPDLFHRVIAPLKKEFPDVLFDGCLVPGREEDWPKLVQMLKDGLLEVTPINTVATYNGDNLFCNPPHVMIEQTRIVQEHGLKAQVAVYSDGDIDNADRYLIKTGLLEKPYHFLILPALPGCSPMHNPRAMVETLMHSYNRIMDIDDTAVVMVCAAGRASSYLATLAVLLGLNIRIGMEDTVWKWPHRNEKLTNNAEVFKSYKQIVELLGREIATADEYRQMIGLPAKNAGK